MTSDQPQRHRATEPAWEENKRPRNGRELVEYWAKLGLFGSRPDIQDGQEHARKIRRQAGRRRHWRHLGDTRGSPRIL